MITRWYIEARQNESWRDVSNLFMEWLKENASLKTFGFSEGGAVDYAGKRLYNFHFPAQHGANISLFKTWAESTGRLFGGEKDGTVHLSNNQILTLAAKAPLAHRRGDASVLSLGPIGGAVELDRVDGREWDAKRTSPALGLLRAAPDPLALAMHRAHADKIELDRPFLFKNGARPPKLLSRDERMSLCRH